MGKLWQGILFLFPSGCRLHRKALRLVALLGSLANNTSPLAYSFPLTIEIYHNLHYPPRKHSLFWPQHHILTLFSNWSISSWPIPLRPVVKGEELREYAMRRLTCCLLSLRNFGVKGDASRLRLWFLHTRLWSIIHDRREIVWLRKKGSASR